MLPRAPSARGLCERSCGANRLRLVTAPLLIAIAAAAVIVLVSYVAGRSAGRRETVPWRPIFQLVDHYGRCLGENHETVRRRLSAALDVPPWAWDELLRRRAPLAAPRRGAEPEPRP